MFHFPIAMKKHPTNENETVRLFNELLPWTYNCPTLIDAARNGRTDQCEELIRMGIDINETDQNGYTALWTSYFHEHLETLFTLLQMGADPNTRSGEILCSDLHRACSYGDRTLTEILIECGGYVNISDRHGKTPLIYALEYPSATNTLDLIKYLVECGAEVNCKDQNGLTPLHYACYRGDYQVMKFLLDHHADISVENAIGYNILRYALSCLSYTSPSQYLQYQNRLHIVDLLVEQYPIGPLLRQAILGEEIHLFPLFDLIFYSLIQQRSDLEEYSWQIFHTLPLTKDFFNTLQLLLQNTFVNNHYFSQVIYISQRLSMGNAFSLLLNYLERVDVDAKPSRYSLLLYLIYVDQGLTYLQMLDDCFHTSLNTSRRCQLGNLLTRCEEKPANLKFYCRRLIRTVLSTGIHCQLNQLKLSPHLQSYLLLHELFFGRF